MAGPRGCRTNPSCLKGVKRKYHLSFKRFRTASSPYEAIGKGRADIAFGFTTDPDLTVGFVGLRDDRHVFPSFHVTMLFRKRALARLGPDARRVVARVQKPLTTRVLRDLNARVFFDKKTPKKVASKYLREAGFVK